MGGGGLELVQRTFLSAPDRARGYRTALADGAATLAPARCEPRASTCVPGWQPFDTADPPSRARERPPHRVTPRIAEAPLIHAHPGPAASGSGTPPDTAHSPVPELQRRSRSRSGAIVRAAKDVSEALEVKALATFTQTGGTARRLAALHPRQPLLAFTVDGRVRSQLALSWGVETFLVPSVQHTDDMVAQVDFSLLSIGRLRVGDRVVVVAGSPPNTVGSTNLIRVHEVGTDS